jgi:predicted phosphodiesterase
MSRVIIPPSLYRQNLKPQVPERIIPWDWARKPPERIIVDSDTHFEIAHVGFHEAKLEFARDVQANHWFNLGDLYDFAPVSRFGRDWYRKPNHLQEELDSAHWYVDEMLRIVDGADIIEGNHEYRLERMLQVNSGLWGLRALSLESLTEWPKTVPVRRHPYGSHVQIGHLWGEHGDQMKSSVNPSLWALRNRAGRVTAFGHTHKKWFNMGSYLSDTGEVTRREVHGLGHGSQEKAQAYAGTVKGWAMSFLYVEHYTIAGKLNIQATPITANERGNFVFNGKVYGPKSPRSKKVAL